MSQWIKLSTVALQVEETTNQTESQSHESQKNQIKMLVFGERGKLEYSTLENLLRA